MDFAAMQAGATAYLSKDEATTRLLERIIRYAIELKQKEHALLASEELGWTAYATDPMQSRWGPIKASLILGIIWAIWHLIPFIQTGSPLNWIVWQSLYTILLRVLIVWMYNQSGRSVFAANLVHVTSNLSWALFPNYGSHYDPFVTGIILLLTVIAALTWSRKGVPSLSSHGRETT